MTSSTVPAPVSASEAPLRPTTTGRRFAARLVDLVIVAALVGVVYLSGLIRIQGCDSFDADSGTFGPSCPFEQTREVEREDGSIEVVYVLGSGRELPVDHPTVKTVVLGTRVVDPPGAATYLVGLGYVLAVFVLLQGITGWTPGKLATGIRLVRDDGRPPGLSPTFLRWLVVDGAIGLFGVLMGLVDGPWPLRWLAADAAVGLLGGLAALSGQNPPGDQLARTQVVDDSEAARARRSRPEPRVGGAPGSGGPEPSPTEPTPATAAAAAAAAAGVGGGADRGPEPPRSEPPRAIPLGPGAGTGQTDEEDADSGTASSAGAVSSSIPRPPDRPEPGVRPLWGSDRPGTMGASGDSGAPDAPEYQTPPPLWESPTPAASAEGGERRQPTPTASGAVAARLVEEQAAGAEPGAGQREEQGGPAPGPGDDQATGAGPEAQEPAVSAAEAQPEPIAAEEAEPAALAERQQQPTPEPSAEASDEPTAEAEPEPEPSTEAAAAAVDVQQQPFWDEARRAYIFWDSRRQEWLEFDYDNQRWGPISRA